MGCSQSAFRESYEAHKKHVAARMKANEERGEALRNAAKGGKLDEVRSLLAKGAPVNSQDKVRTPPHI